MLENAKVRSPEESTGNRECLLTFLLNLSADDSHYPTKRGSHGTSHSQKRFNHRAGLYNRLNFLKFRNPYKKIFLIFLDRGSNPYRNNYFLWVLSKYS